MKQLNTIGIVGAGTMGAAIAQHFAMKQRHVVLVDNSQANLERGLQHIGASLDQALARRIIREPERQAILDRIQPSTALDALANCGLIVEAIIEDFEVKRQLFGQLERLVADQCILASNTSSFEISALAEALEKPQRFVGIHYFYHAAKNKLVEIIGGEKTDARVVADLSSEYWLLDKIPITVRDRPGFAVNRFFVPWLNEAARLHEEALGTPAFIDDVAEKTFGVGMGPFALMNATGVPIAEHSAANLAAAFGGFYHPAEALVRQAGSGEPWEIDADDRHGDEQRVRERLLATTLGVACQLVSEGVVDAAAVDLAARVGLRWPSGPFELINRVGVEETRRLVSQLFDGYDLALPALLADPPAQGIRLEVVSAQKCGTTAFVEFCKPDTMNALDEAVMTQLAERFDALDADPQIERIIFLGQGKAFVAGADIKYFIERIDEGELTRIVAFTRAGQAIFARIANSAKTTIAYIDGLALGGGLELALACDYRIGTSRTLLAFPETGIGIYPGLGGTQRTTRLVGVGAAKYLVATGTMLNATAALEMGLIDDVRERSVDKRELANLKTPRRNERRPGPEAGFADFDGTFGPEKEWDPIITAHEKQLRRKAPLALQQAMRLIGEGRELPLERALNLELEGLERIFATRDARIGLQSVIDRCKPSFNGE